MIFVLVPHQRPATVVHGEPGDVFNLPGAGTLASYTVEQLLDTFGDDVPAEALRLAKEHGSAVELEASGDTSWASPADAPDAWDWAWTTATRDLHRAAHYPTLSEALASEGGGHQGARVRALLEALQPA